MCIIYFGLYLYFFIYFTDPYYNPDSSLVGMKNEKGITNAILQKKKNLHAKMYNTFGFDPLSILLNSSLRVIFISRDCLPFFLTKYDKLPSNGCDGRRW